MKTKEEQFIQAVNNNELVEVGRLISENRDLVEVRQKNGWTVLMVAAWEGYAEVAEILLKKGAKINAVNDTPMKMSFKSSHGNESSTLLSNDNTTALMRAAMRGHVEVTKVLLKFKPDVSMKDYSGKTALDLASPEVADLIKEYLQDTPM